MDAVDAALVSFDKNKIKLIDTASIKMPLDIKKNILELSQQKFSINLLGQTDTKLGHLFSKVSLKLLKKSTIKSNEITAIGSHGQTIFHQPNSNHPFTLQIADPNIIAAKTNITTVADFRRRDIAEGGQGAPLVPAFHAYLFSNLLSNKKRDQFVVNIGGIANLTYLPKNKTQKVIGFDTGPGNTLLDQWCFLNLKKAMDRNGRWAKRGKINTQLLAILLKDPYFKKAYPKSTGCEYFNLNWLNNKLEKLKQKLKPEDIQATLIELTAKSIADDLLVIIKKTKKNKMPVWICGGGAKNTYLMDRLQKHCPDFLVQSTSKMNIDPQWIEAMAFAWLAKQTIEKKSGNLISVTGSKKSVILGGIYYR